MSVECLFSITPSYKRVKEEEEEDNQRRWLNYPLIQTRG